MRAIGEERAAGELMYNSIRDGPRLLRVLLVASGYDSEDVNRWTENAVDEIANWRVKFWIKVLNSNSLRRRPNEAADLFFLD